MKIKGIIWLGTRTDRFDQMTDFCQNLPGLSPRVLEPGFSVLMHLIGRRQPRTPASQALQ